MEIARKQRHLHLLQKVKENKTLSRAELDELNKYERQAAGKITASIKPSTKQSTKQSTKPSTKRVKKKAGKKKVKKKGRPGRPSIRRRSAGWDSNART